MFSQRNEFVDYVVELISGWANISVRKMFGGYSLYREGLMFALISNDELFFKVDADSIAQFERLGCRPFIYTSQKKTVRLSYWSAPDGSLDAPAEMHHACQTAYGAALHALAAKSGKGKSL